MNLAIFGIIELTKYANAPGDVGASRGLAQEVSAPMRGHSIPTTTEDTTEPLPCSRSAAIALGAKHYFTGKPCPKGHVAPRFVSNCGCAECLRLQSRRYHEQHKERNNARAREYAKRDREGNRRRSNKWFRENRERVLAAHRERHARNSQPRRQASMKWYRANPEKAAAQRRLRRARLKAAGGNVTAEEWESIKAQYGYKCLRCGRADQPLTMDHVVPLVRGGTHTADNVQPLCGSCNRAKYTALTDYRGQVQE